MLLRISIAAGLAIASIPRSAPPPVAIYGPVLEHVTRERPVRLLRPVTLAEQVYRARCGTGCGAEPAAFHQPQTLAALRRRSLIASSCRAPEAHFGCGPARNVFVALGAVIPLAPGTRIPPVLDLPPGALFPQVFAAAEHGEKVDVDAAVDVILYVPCPEPPVSDRCRVPDITMYRYYLQKQEGGAYRVVARIPTGAV